MNAAPCNPNRKVYTSSKRLRNARLSGPAHRHSAFFMPVLRQSPIGELAGMHSSNAVRCTQSQFLSPARSPAPRRFYSVALGDC